MMRDISLPHILLLQCWGIVLVVLGHSMPYDGMTGIYSTLFKWIYAFHMPLFFAISGFLYAHNEDKYIESGASKFLSKKFIRLLVPYLILNMAVVPFKWLLGEFTYREINLSSFIYLDQIPIGNLWFLVVLFLIFFIVTIFIYFKRRIPISIIGLLVLVGISMAINVCGLSESKWNVLGIVQTVQNLPYFYLGCILYRNRACLNHFAFGLIGYGVILIYVMIGCSMFPILVALIGVISSFWLAANWNLSHRLFIMIGQYSYQIYLLSWFPQVFMRIVLSDSPIVHVPYIIQIILSFILGIFIPIIVTKIIAKTKLKIIIGL